MYELLKSQFEDTKKTLQDVEDNIRRITGRDPDQFAISGTGNIKWKNEAAFSGNTNSFPSKKRSAPYVPRPDGVQPEEPCPADEESGDEDGVPAKKPSLQSTIVATHRDVKSRKDTIAEQKSDRKGMARNRRMFGMILGTLQKFQNEESRRKEQAQKRAEIDKKVEEAAEKEKELMKKEKECLFTTRREKQTQIRCLEKKLEIAELHEVWEKDQKFLVNFIQTSAKPQLMFLPSKHNIKSQKCLEESQERIVAMLQVHREKFEKELSEIDEWYKKDDMQHEEPGDKENIGPFDDAELPENSVPEPNLCVSESETQISEVRERTKSEERKIEGEEGIETERKDKTMEANSMDTDKNSVIEILADQEFEPIYDE